MSSTHHLSECATYSMSDCTCGAPSKKPTAKVVGQDGNAMVVMGIVSNALRRAGASKAYVDAYYAESTSGDYDHLLMTAWKFANLT